MFSFGIAHWGGSYLPLAQKENMLSIGDVDGRSNIVTEFTSDKIMVIEMNKHLKYHSLAMSFREITRYKNVNSYKPLDK